MARIVQRPRARIDVAEIWDYIAEDSLLQADAFVNRLDAKLRILSGQPELGRMREEIASGLRSFPIGRYVVFYEIFAEELVVIRVLHSARDVHTQFDTDFPDN